MAVRAESTGKAELKPVHHSDRGCQYYCHAYVDELKKHGFGISMTGERHCYENALAERVNGILKQEYALGGAFKSKVAARKAISGAVRLFNRKRPIKPIRSKKRRNPVNLFQDLTL